MIKKAVRVIGFLLLVVLLMIIAMKLLRFKSQDGIDQMYAFYENVPNTIDVLFLGSSHMYTNINTGILWEDYGISSYDLGGADQPFWNTYYNMKETLKTQNPKVIVVEIYSAAAQKGHYQGIWTVENLFGMKFGLNFFDSATESVKEDWHKDYFNRFARYHSRYSMITEDDFTYASRMKTFKGYVPKYGASPQERRDVSQVIELVGPSEKMADYMIKMIDLAKAENIPIVLVCAPYAINEDAQKIFNCFYQYAEENGVPYIDCNVRYDEIGMDFEQDMYDWSHLNEKGSAKYTKYLGDYLKANYELEDHRGDAKYTSWDKNAEILEHDYQAYLLKQIGDLQGYLMQINGDDSYQNAKGGDSVTSGLTDSEKNKDEYIVMLSARNINDVNIFSEDVLDSLAKLGMNETMLLEGGNVFFHNGTVEYSHSGMNYEWSGEADGHDFYMERVYIESVEDEFGENMHDVSRIVVDGKDYFMSDALLNIVVYDPVLERVVDAVGARVSGEGLVIKR